MSHIKNILIFCNFPRLLFVQNNNLNIIDFKTGKNINISVERIYIFDRDESLYDIENWVIKIM